MVCLFLIYIFEYNNQFSKTERQVGVSSTSGSVAVDGSSGFVCSGRVCMFSADSTAFHAHREWWSSWNQQQQLCPRMRGDELHFAGWWFLKYSPFIVYIKKLTRVQERIRRRSYHCRWVGPGYKSRRRQLYCFRHLWISSLFRRIYTCGHPLSGALQPWSLWKRRQVSFIVYNFCFILLNKIQAFTWRSYIRWPQIWMTMTSNHPASATTHTASSKARSTYAIMVRDAGSFQ